MSVVSRQKKVLLQKLTSQNDLGLAFFLLGKVWVDLYMSVHVYSVWGLMDDFVPCGLEIPY